MEHNLVSAHLSQQQEGEDLAEVIKGASTALVNLQLAQSQVLEVLLNLLVSAKERTAAIFKECTSGYNYDDDYHKQCYIYTSYQNMRLAIRKLLELYVQKHSCPNKDSEKLVKLCRTYLYVSFVHTELFLSAKLNTPGDLKHFRAEQVLAILVNAIDIMQTFMPGDKSGFHSETQTLQSPNSQLATNTTKILEVVNLSVNRLVSESRVTADIAAQRTVAVLNIINRLIINPEFMNLGRTEKDTVCTLIVLRVSVIQLWLFNVRRSSSGDSSKKILCKIISSALSCYEVLVNDISWRSNTTQKQVLEGSLEFSLIRNLALAAEIRTQSSSLADCYATRETVYARYAKKIFDSVYASITAYSRQLMLRERYPIYAKHIDYSTCLNYTERALQNTRTLRSKIRTYGIMAEKYTQTLEASLSESIELCTHRIQKKDAQTGASNPYNRINENLVLDPFLPRHIERPSALLDSIDEEMWLQGRRGGGMQTTCAKYSQA
ncbi:hypothetical protein [Anaplasma platys]|nr:hypothetical protein [Anaplasma platys]